ncbi:DUF3103 family protein (plasmid) [Deinococcus metallilatus]|uniref:DUF3103 family protein n=1 Tax=Deinococcus metallilatus TaxID=1211322 RepID=A0AAJ5F5Q6_9DEIO|nr:DUF3103 family protein [Deinococcus metallilatus]MBB5293348.1 hypothetical protein [Deinococcus metallilatus]QBY06454.1 DUF3103 family protein [Deinococcus metallilatus]RXJ18133.1 DUF3103 family protein [Deinococcus metallilatus]TLK32069.1 DUF3103 family protein [Deinococcus metallilatus]GMA15429.1 hypothetical protein GCM10025871_17600 [Deinococcus metallilatus]
MRPHLTLACLSFALLASACMQANPPSATTPTPEQSASSDAAVNAALHTFARQLARALPNPEVRAAIQQQANLRFDGDSEALYRTLAVQPAGGTTLEALIAGQGVGAQSTEARLQALRAVTSQVSGLQVAVRGGSWDTASEVPLVAVAPQGGDEFAPVTAYDAAGQVHTLDARQVPSQPVVVVGVNERTDEQGNLIAGLVSPGSALGTQSCDNKERLKSVYVRDKHEPWVRGDPEIYVKLGSNKIDNVYTGSLINVNDTNRWYDIGRDLVTWSSTSVGNWMMYFWYERDGGSSITVTLNGEYKGVGGSVSFHIADGDDRMGNALVGFGERQTTSTLDTGDVRWTRGACL